jgi:hypothetical protein
MCLNNASTWCQGKELIGSIIYLLDSRYRYRYNLFVSQNKYKSKVNHSLDWVADTIRVAASVCLCLFMINCWGGSL